MQKHTELGAFGGVFHGHRQDPRIYIVYYLPVSLLYLLALGKSHTLDWENKDTSKNLYPQDLNV
jgi:hypothetical protein